MVVTQCRVIQGSIWAYIRLYEVGGYYLQVENQMEREHGDEMETIQISGQHESHKNGKA